MDLCITCAHCDTFVSANKIIDWLIDNNFRVADSTYWTGYFNRIYNYFHYHCIIFVNIHVWWINMHIHIHIHTYNHDRSMPSPAHIQDLLCTLVWFVSSWHWMPHCTVARTSTIPRTSRRLPQSPHRDCHSSTSTSRPRGVTLWVDWSRRSSWGQICPSGSPCREIVVIPWHSYGVPFSHLFTALEISPIELEISTIDLQISTIHLEISPDRLNCRYLQLNWRYLQFNCRYLQFDRTE